GVKDFGAAAGAWNSTMAKATGRALPLRGQLPLTAQLDPNGGVTVESSIKTTANPDELDNVFGGPSVTPPLVKPDTNPGASPSANSPSSGIVPPRVSPPLNL